MVRGNQQFQRIVEQELLVEAAVGARRSGLSGDDHCQVGVVGQQQVKAFGRVCLDDPHLHRRPGGPQRADHRGQQGRGGGGESADPQRARVAAGFGGQQPADVFPAGEQGVEMAEQDARGGAQRTPRPCGMSNTTSRSSAKVRSWWETVEGV